jgi:hypothetical protein
MVRGKREREKERREGNERRKGEKGEKESCRRYHKIIRLLEKSII